MTIDDFTAMTPTQRTRWLRRERWVARLFSCAGWTLIVLVGLVACLSVIKTFVLYGPLAAFFAFLVWSSAMLLPWVIRSIWRLFTTTEG